MIYLRLFFEFCRAGLFAVGGGLATLPFLQDISERTGWFTTDQLADMVAVSECTPGPIGVNMSTYTGYIVAGVPGAVIATLGLIFPSVIVILIVARILRAFRNNRYVEAAFYGLRPASTALITAACLSVAALALFGSREEAGFIGLLSAVRVKALILALVLWLLMNTNLFNCLKDQPALKKIRGLHPVFFLGASAVIGILFRFAE